ncbi:MAG: hypothetical protein ACRD2C_21425 [Acidimicrobiales bacterium]
MSDDQLDRLVADISPFSDPTVTSLDLRHAETELMEEIMATDMTEVDLGVGGPRDETKRQRLRRGHRVAIGAVAAAAAIVAAVLVVGGGGDEPENEGDVSTQPPPEIPRLLADVVPDGYELTSTVDAPQEQHDQEIVSDDVRVTRDAYLYGDADAENPFESGDLVITTLRHSAEDPDGGLSMYPGEQVEVQVRGHDGLVCSPDACSADGATTVHWLEEPGFEVSLTSRSLDQDQLLAIAEGLEISNEQILLGGLPPDLPVPADELARDGEQARNPHAVAHMATYRQPHAADDPRPLLDDRPSLTVSAGPGDESTMLWEVVSYDARHRVEVRGHDGWFVSRQASPPAVFPGGGYSYSPASSLVIWEEQPGVIVSVTATGSSDLAEDDLLHVAESLHPASDEEWEAVLEDRAPIDPAEVESHVPDDAVAFVITDQLGGAAYLSADGQVCGFVVDSEGEGLETCGSADQRVHELRDREGEVRFLFGTMPDGAADVAATNQYSADDAVPAFHDDAPEEGPTLYVLPLDFMVPETIAFRDGTGQPVETVPYPSGRASGDSQRVITR